MKTIAVLVLGAIVMVAVAFIAIETSKAPEPDPIYGEIELNGVKVEYTTEGSFYQLNAGYKATLSCDSKDPKEKVYLYGFPWIIATDETGREVSFMSKSYLPSDYLRDFGFDLPNKIPCRVSFIYYTTDADMSDINDHTWTYRAVQPGDKWTEQNATITIKGSS